MNIKNHVAESHLRVLVGIFESNDLIVDGNGFRCYFNSTIHNPLDMLNKRKGGMLRLYRNNQDHHGINNKEEGGGIKFLEMYYFLSHINKLYKQNMKDIYLGV